ncbi:MAG TPA: M1 family metallopeptidase [Vicinamibacteria bacterium]
MRLPLPIALGGLVLLLAPWAATRGDAPPPPAARGLPALSEDPSLPPLPAQSPRNANYTIQARLDPDQHTLQGSEVLEWRNTSGTALSTFPFHLYWNAFRNNLSTSARGEGRRSARSTSEKERERGYGYIQVRSIRLVDGNETDLTPSIKYLAPDDGNPDDRTVMEVTTASPVAPGATVRFKIDWTSRIPYGDVGRAGWVHDYFFIVQWFPKIGVWWKGAWNAHQFHPWTEFFADYGVYDVRLTLPRRGFVVGATGRLQEKTDDADGTETYRFVQEDVHDFAWTASPRFREKKALFDDPGYPPVEIRLLHQPEHSHLADRYVEATRIALRSYGAWSAPYPYPQITVIDPPWNSASGGMEYPTLFTGGAFIWAPRALQSPEGVTIHECGHQFWYALVGNNEFEEAWLDEGFNSYHDEKAARLALGPVGWGRRYFGLVTPARGSRGGWPVVAPGVWIGRGEADLSNLRRSGETDVMARRGWEYRAVEAYGLNSYGKPALTLQTLENLVGDDTMTRIMRTYARRFRFAHPTTEDFIATVNEVTGRDYRWYFDQTWFSSDLCDYAVSVKSEKARTLEGYGEGPDGMAVLNMPREEKEDDAKTVWESEVTVRRLGGVKMPVEVMVSFADGRAVTETWDGQYRWTRFRYRGAAKVVRAVVDPGGKLAIDVNPANNDWVDEDGWSRRAALKWSARWMFWLQNLLETHAVIG